MKRSTTQWTTTLAACALLGMPAAGLAQTGSSAQQPPAATSAPAEPSQPGDHLREARTALASIDGTAVTGRAKTQLAELKKHLSALEVAAAAKSSASSSAKTPARASSWAADVAAVDRILSEMLGSTATAGATGTVGTAGTTGTAPVATNEATRARLQDVRKHVTKFAAAMSGTAVSSDAAAPEAASPAHSPATGSSTGSTASAAGATSSSPTLSPTNTSMTPGAPGQVDTTAARRHLTEARDSLTAMTQLPAAASLAGETRTHVTALIANFNELITNQTDWRASYTKVEDNLKALLGPENAVVTGSAAATSTAATSGTAGAVGTSGTGAETIDPALRAKLVELRAKLNEFERAIGGSPASGSTAPDSAAAARGSGSAAGSTMPSDPQVPAQAATQAGATTNDDAMQHLAAIEAILNGSNPAAPGTTGTSGTTAAPPAPTSGESVTLSRTQIELLRTHLSELRKAIDKK